jgi:uncharacterized protein (TIGR00730 family)
MKITFIGSGVERETTQVTGIEVQAIARLVSAQFDTLVFGGSSIGLMEAFATAFASAGGRVVSVVPRWFEQEGLVYKDCDPVLCESLAERKRLMFEETDAVLCYPGGLGTWDELFDLLAQRAVESEIACPPIYLYNWEKFYAPLLLQMETAAEVGFVQQETLAKVRPFESVDALSDLLQREQASVLADLSAPMLTDKVGTRSIDGGRD